jgi:histidine triad (HIT) family protein
MPDCKTCQQIKEKKGILYEDETAVALVPESAACKGHIIIAPKQHRQTLDETEDKETQHLFFLANFAASSQFQTIGAQGTNIIASSGNTYKDDGTHFTINVLPRKQNDGINFTVNGNKAEEAELDSISKKIKDKTDLIGVAKPKKEVIDLDKKPDLVIKEKEENTAEKRKSEDEQNKKENAEEKQDGKKEKESSPRTPKGEENYLIKQLRRIP